MHAQVYNFTYPGRKGFVKPSACGLWQCSPGFLKLLWFARRYVCLSVCLSISEGINNQWRDMVRVRLVKQVLWLFPAFNYLIRHLLLIKSSMHSHINTVCRECLPKKTKVMWTTRKTFIKVSG